MSFNIRSFGSDISVDGSKSSCELKWCVRDEGDLCLSLNFFEEKGHRPKK